MTGASADGAILPSEVGGPSTCRDVTAAVIARLAWVSPRARFSGSGRLARPKVGANGRTTSVVGPQPTAWPGRVRVVELGPRDGFQPEPGCIPTAAKVRTIDALVAVARDVERLVGHPLPGYVMTAGPRLALHHLEAVAAG